MSIYSKKVMKHFKNPHNYGKIAGADGIGEVGNIVCGDVMYLYIKLGKNKQGKNIIKQISFETYGCAAAIATSSVITDLARNKTLDEALSLSKDHVITALDTLPPIKVHCSLLAIDALQEAIFDYLSKNKKPISQSLQKKHEHNQKNKCSVENRYGDWVSHEKKSLKKS